LDLWCVCLVRRTRHTHHRSASHQTHTPQVQISRCQTPNTHTTHHK